MLLPASDPVQAALSIRGLSLGFGGIKAIEDVSFEVPHGDICGLIGPNGAGKTSMFNCISGFYRPASGSIDFEGSALLGLRPHEIVNRGIARTFQHASLFQTIPVFENVLLGAFHHLRSGFFASFLPSGRYDREETELHTRAEEALDLLGLTPYRNVLAADLPFGLQKRVDIARGLAASPRLLLLDEPAAGLTQAELVELSARLLSIRERFGCTMILVEHNMRFVRGLATRVVALEFGRKIVDDVADAAFQAPALIEAYLGPREAAT